jgi:CheY-like chemotaxis protein
MTNDELFDFAEPQRSADQALGSPWQILIVDDEPGVHEVTEFALSRVSFRDRPLQFHHAYSGREAIEKFRRIDDLALIFLDVVMESDDAGLRVVRELREDMDARTVRIILRTGQPGVAPERKVIVDYDINDYKAKTELSADKLFVATIGALRAYDDLKTIEELKKLALSTLAHETGLEQQILDATPIAMMHTDQLFSITGLNAHAATLLGQAASVILGSPLYTLFDQSTATRIAQANGPQEMRIDRARTADGRALNVVATAYHLADGKPGGVILRLEPTP